MTANTYSASQREAQQTRSGLKHTNAKRAYAGGLGDSPTSGRSRFPARENERTACLLCNVHIKAHRLLNWNLWFINLYNHY